LTTSRARFLLVSLVIVTLLGTASLLGAQVRRSSPEPDSLFKYLAVFTEALSLVRQAYVEDVDLQALLGGAYAGATEALDPFSVYVPPDKVARFLRLGDPEAQSGLLLIRERGWLVVAGVLEGSPAQDAGLRRGDLVVKVGAEPTTMLEVWQVHEQLAAAGEEPVALEVVRRQDRKELSFTMAPWDREPVTSSTHDEISVLRISHFVESTAEAAARALAQLEGDLLLVDLRGVVGGDAEQAYRVGELLASGELGSLKKKGEVQRRFVSGRDPVWSGTVAVMVDRGTLGASEVLAKVLAERVGAQVVGEPTFGHAGRQEVVRLTSGAVLKVTDAFYTGPGGEVIDDSVEPDVLVSERSRTLQDRDLSLQDLILRRGVETLRQAAAPAAESAAA
jgi:carboxyl-terminal processing protease